MMAKLNVAPNIAMSTPLLATITTRASNASTSRRVKATTPRPSANAASRALPTFAVPVVRFRSVS